MTSAKEEFSNQIDVMTHYMDSQPLSLAIPVIVQWPVNKVAMVADRDGVDNMDLPLTKVVLDIAASECQVCQQQRPTMSPRYGIIPKSAPVSNLVAS